MKIETKKSSSSRNVAKNTAVAADIWKGHSKNI
jgi:hypothetical protein